MPSPLDDLLRQRESGEMALPSDGQLEGQCPNLWEFLTRQWWEPGRGRAPGSVTIRLASGCWQVSITDPQAKCTKTAVSLLWSDIPTVLEALLSDVNVPWKPFAKAQLTKRPK